MTSTKKTAFHKIAKKKGWRLIDIGGRWGISERQMSRIANNPSRKDIDAVTGLPVNKKASKK